MLCRVALLEQVNPGYMEEMLIDRVRLLVLSRIIRVENHWPLP
jgi:hypothetical protein